jgi:hypothetical protein
MTARPAARREPAVPRQLPAAVAHFAGRGSVSCLHSPSCCVAEPTVAAR